MTKLAGTIFKIINIIVVVLYLSTCMIPVLPAGKFWMIAVLGLVFPLLFLMVTGFMICWLIARSRWFMLSMVALVLSWQQLSVMAGLNLKNEFDLSKKNAKTLRILTWNTSSWGESSKRNNNTTKYHQVMFDLVRKQHADVLCFQEFWDKKNWSPQYSNVHALKEMGYPYSYFVSSSFRYSKKKSGIVIFSKYPIIDTAKFSFTDDDDAKKYLIYADIQFNQQKIRVFTTHLQSVRFEDEEYSAISKIKHTDESGLKDSKTIVRKLKNAYESRCTQADLVQQKIRESPYPVIICGDFNDVPNSYTYFTIKGNLQDAFLKKGTGFGRTFRFLSPTLRIDYILSAKNFEVEQYKQVHVPYSDHYPVIADFGY